MTENSQKQQNNLSFLFVARQFLYSIFIAFFPAIILILSALILSESKMRLLHDNHGVIIGVIAMLFTVPIGITFFLVRITGLSVFFVARQVFYATCIAFSPCLMFLCHISDPHCGTGVGMLVPMLMLFTVPIGIVFFFIRIILAKRKLKQPNV